MNQLVYRKLKTFQNIFLTLIMQTKIK